jgi:hypothetical protein
MFWVYSAAAATEAQQVWCRLSQRRESYSAYSAWHLHRNSVRGILELVVGAGDAKGWVAEEVKFGNDLLDDMRYVGDNHKLHC